MSFVTLLIFSCSKTKESKRWKAYEGIYTSSQVNYQIMDSIYINEIDVSEAGISLVNGVKTYNMNVLSRELCDNPNYEYQCTFSNITSYSFNGSELQNGAMSKEEFEKGRKFYLNFEDDKLTFTIIGNSGIEHQYYYK